jgi:hypothetical protein
VQIRQLAGVGQQKLGLPEGMLKPGPFELVDVHAEPNIGDIDSL